ncbi:hypothetical protein BQ8794_410006 [Mesorhizobium prunaredense]|uniref:Uncharacterized protein n=1 Tax=Mesorhizobium prunaredense TaxID=1631249 RepID=A0A1R3VDF3_9HYPH|nr:hypothetical protein BQ8794_410006 [Mesorhizobium prunaredense]
MPAAGRPGGDLARRRSRVKLYQLVAANGRNGWEVAIRLNSQNEHVAPTADVCVGRGERRDPDPLRPFHTGTRTEGDEARRSSCIPNWLWHTSRVLFDDKTI